MALTALELPPHALKSYHPADAIQRRKTLKTAEHATLTKRRRRAIVAARKAAELLRKEFGAKKIFVFGSLARRGGFTSWSDIDIAAKGIPPKRFFEAVGAIAGLSAEFKIDLIDIEKSPATMQKTIETEGKPL